jgi:beta-lactamase regulating signal transducer with metallopeptidase domain
MNTAASIVACISYVSVIVTFLACVRTLLWKKHVYSKRMQIFLLGYVSAMFLLATSSFFQELAYFSTVIFPNSDNSASSSSAEHKLFNVPVALPFTIWGADVFMVSSKNVLFVPRAYLCLVDVEMLHAVPGIITVSPSVSLSSPIVSCCGYNLYGLKWLPFP